MKMNLLDQVLSEKDVKDILYEAEFEHIEGGMFWSCNYEERVEVKLVGNKLHNLIRWIISYYTKKAGEYGESRRKSELRQSIKSLLRID